MLQFNSRKMLLFEHDDMILCLAFPDNCSQYDYTIDTHNVIRLNKLAYDKTTKLIHMALRLNVFSRAL